MWRYGLIFGFYLLIMIPLLLLGPGGGASLSGVVELIAFLVLVGFTAYAGYAAVRYERYARTPPIIRDVSAEGRIPNLAMQTLITPLETLGFRRLGEYAGDLPRRPNQTGYVFMDKTNTVRAEVVWLNGNVAMAGFATVFSDEALVETLYPFGHNLNKPNYLVQFNTQTLNAAYVQHRTAVAQWRREHGTLQQFHTMSDVLTWKDRDQALYRPYRLPSRLWANLLIVGCLCAIVVDAGVVFWGESILGYSPNPSNPLVIFGPPAFAILALFVMLANQSSVPAPAVADLQVARARQEEAVRKAERKQQESEQ